MGLLSAFLKTGTIMIVSSSVRNSEKVTGLIEYIQKIISRYDKQNKIATFVLGTNNNFYSCEKQSGELLNQIKINQVALELLITTYVIIFFSEIIINVLRGNFTFLVFLFASFKTLLILMLSSYLTSLLVSLNDTQKNNFENRPNDNSHKEQITTFMAKYGLTSTFQENIQKLICKERIHYIPIILYFSIETVM